MYKTFYEDIVINSPISFGRYEMTKEEILDFANRFDPQPFHTDEAFAKTTHFGGLCASGWHTSSAAMRMIVDHYAEIGLAGLGSPGLDGLKWPIPVFVGDILSVKQEFITKRRSKSRPGLGLVTFRNYVYNHHDKIVAEMTGTMMIKCRT